MGNSGGWGVMDGSLNDGGGGGVVSGGGVGLDLGGGVVGRGGVSLDLGSGVVGYGRSIVGLNWSGVVSYGRGGVSEGGLGVLVSNNGGGECVLVIIGDTGIGLAHAGESGVYSLGVVRHGLVSIQRADGLLLGRSDGVRGGVLNLRGGVVHFRGGVGGVGGGSVSSLGYNGSGYGGVDGRSGRVVTYGRCVALGNNGGGIS